MRKRHGHTTIAFIALFASLISILWNVVVTNWVSSKNIASQKMTQDDIESRKALAEALSRFAKELENE